MEDEDIQKIIKGVFILGIILSIFRRNPLNI